MLKQKDVILFQGRHKKKDYFEGWYFKQASADGRYVISFIPGISLFEGNPHCFVQYILGSMDEDQKVHTITGNCVFPMKAFQFGEDPFFVAVGENFFSSDKMILRLQDNHNSIEGEIHFGTMHPIKTSLWNPTIMGPFSYIPFMECYHDVISMNHAITGNLVINGQWIDFTGGKGYIEKDRGSSFPTQYIWIQSNHFTREDTSLFASFAHIPFLKSSFTGFIANLVCAGKEYRFATYNRTKLSIAKISQEAFAIHLSNPKAKLTIEGFMHHAGELIAPERGKMSKTIKEGICGEVHMILNDLESRWSYEDTGRLAGIEVVGYSEAEGT